MLTRVNNTAEGYEEFGRRIVTVIQNATTKLDYENSTGGLGLELVPLHNGSTTGLLPYPDNFSDKLKPLADELFDEWKQKLFSALFPPWYIWLLILIIFTLGIYTSCNIIKIVLKLLASIAHNKFWQDRNQRNLNRSHGMRTCVLLPVDDGDGKMSAKGQGNTKYCRCQCEQDPSNV